MWHPIKHYKTIHHHKMLVMQGCFRCGLYWQGLTHDLSKLSPVEFWAGAKYWQGTCSPNNAQRKAEGYSAAWLHHKGRNKHHLEYWIDYAPNGDHAMAGMRMPNRYVAEMVCDRIAASKNYKGTRKRCLRLQLRQRRCPVQPPPPLRVQQLPRWSRFLHTPIQADKLPRQQP